MIGEWEEQGHPESTVGEGVQEGVAGGNRGDDQEGGHGAEAQGPGAGGGEQADEESGGEGVGGAAVAKGRAVGNAQTKGDDVEIREQGEGGEGDHERPRPGPGPEGPSETPAGGESDGEVTEAGHWWAG